MFVLDILGKYSTETYFFESFDWFKRTKILKELFLASNTEKVLN